MANKSNLEFVNSMLLDLKTGNEAATSVKFFRKNIQTVAIWLYLLSSHFNGKSINFEKIYDEVNKIKRTSKPSIKQFLEDASQLSFVIFEKNENDKRSKIIKPTKITIDEFIEWKKLFD